jgi:hypothetical protein
MRTEWNGTVKKVRSLVSLAIIYFSWLHCQAISQHGISMSRRLVFIIIMFQKKKEEGMIDATTIILKYVGACCKMAENWGNCKPPGPLQTTLPYLPNECTVQYSTVLYSTNAGNEGRFPPVQPKTGKSKGIFLLPSHFFI